MIQLLSKNSKTLYLLLKSELFPDFRSVLQEAIALNIDLTDLLVESENIDNLVWKGANLKGISFNNCSMKKNEFIDCKCSGLSFNNCDLSSLKVKKSKFRDYDFNGCNLSLLSFRNSYSYNCFIIGSKLRNASFFKSKLDHTGFHTTDISETIFEKCKHFQTTFVHTQPASEWIKDTYFVNCKFKECEMEYVDDLALLYFWNSNVRKIKFKHDEQFTTVGTDNGKVIYAIDSDVVWWKRKSWKFDAKELYRGTLKEFQDEVNNGFPTTDVYPEMADIDTDIELQKVCDYLDMWKKKKSEG